MHENEVSGSLIDAAIQVHIKLGPGLLESVYERALEHELNKRSFSVARQVVIPITYDGLVFDEGFRADLIVNDLVVVELKSIESLSPVHSKVLLTYLRLANKRLGLLINFGVVRLKDGIRRIVNNLDE
jgi:GxxExxY protein